MNDELKKRLAAKESNPKQFLDSLSPEQLKLKARLDAMTQSEKEAEFDDWQNTKINELFDTKENVLLNDDMQRTSNKTLH